MGGTTAQAQVDKRPYKNQTAGWLGVVQLDHLGAQIGVSIEPYGVIYLSDEEAILTARAPRNPKDNPFVAKPYMFEDQTGKQVEQDMVPLVLITDDREVPSQERFVPGVADVPEAIAAARRDADAALAREDDREVPTQAAEPVLVPSSSAAVPPSHARAQSPDGSAPAEPEEDQRSSWTENSERTEVPQPGALGGSNEPAPKPPEGDEAKEGSPTAERQQAPMPQPIQRAQSSVEEEHAAHTASGEETGAADTPVGDPPQGEFAAHEEVGTPDAPTQSAS